mmetsp:Transcript_6937/g.11067  ORF Transcript_6937/g.11067 Transcript_6937/m.11067 type:complete len:310 (-) Transcript_6937:83-1012(-)
MGTHRIHHIAARRARVRSVGQLAEGLRPKVRGQDNQRLFEIRRPALSVGQHPIVQHLQQHVEHIRMRLFDLIKEDHLIRTPPHRFGQNPALVIADIARRGANQPRDRMLLHELRHVDANHGPIVVKQKLGQGFGQLGLAHARWTKEQERAQRAVFIIQPRARPADRIGNRPNGGILPDNAGMQLLFHTQQLVTFPFQHFGHRDTGPTLHDTGDLLGTYSFGDHGVAFGPFGLGQLAFQFGDHAIRQLARFGQVPLPLGNLKCGAGLVQLLLDVAGRGQFVPLALPLGGHFRTAFLHLGKILFQGFKAVL